MEKCENCYHAKVCKNYPNTGIPEKSRQRLLNKGCENFKDKSLIVELPCRVGDKVYYINTILHISLYLNHIYEATVTRIVKTKDFVTAVIQIHNENGCTEIPDIKDFGKTVFLSREEAERALEERGENG